AAMRRCRPRRHPMLSRAGACRRPVTGPVREGSGSQDMISLMLFTALPAATAAQPQHVVPMWMHGRHPAVEVRLAGRGDPLRFVVDSAAGATVVDSRIARGYGLEEPPADDAGIMVQGAADNSSRLQPVRETEWSLGTLTLKQAALHTDLSALGTPEAPVD